MAADKAMESSSSDQNSTPNAKRHGMFYQLQIVLIVAFILATLFTAWTPASLLPGNLGYRDGCFPDSNSSPTAINRNRCWSLG